MFSVAQLLLPVSADHVCGADISFSNEVDAIARARTYDDPTLDQGEWLAALKEADWDFVASRCAALIASQSKDLRLAAWLAEALARTRGLRGLGDGYAVMAGLCEHYWDGLYPPAEDGDYEQRIGNLHWLLTRTPALVREMPAARPATPATPDDAAAEYCLAMLGELERVVDLRLGAEGPGFSAARDALRCLVRAAPDGAAVATLDGGGGGNGGNGGNGAEAAGAPAGSRAQALAQLRQVADFFRRTEPHSPVAYLAEKAASWGEMPLHVWLRAVIKDPAAVADIEELLGAPKSAE